MLAGGFVRLAQAVGEPTPDGCTRLHEFDILSGDLGNRRPTLKERELVFADCLGLRESIFDKRT